MRRSLLRLLTLLAAPLAAQAAEIQLEAPDSSCHLDISSGNPTGAFSIVADAAGTSCGCISGAEFRVVGLTNDWFVTVTASPQAIVTLGSPFGTGTNIAFATCQPQRLVLFSVTISYIGSGTPPATMLRVEAHATPSNPQYSCPLILGDIGVTFCQMCVPGGMLFINQTGDCAVATNSETWSEVKHRYE